MALVLVGVVRFGVADDNVEMHSHLHGGATVEFGLHTDAVIAGFVGGECELALGRTPGRGDDVVVFDFSNSNVNTHVVLDNETLQSGVPLFGHVVPHDDCVIGKLFQKTFRNIGFEVEVERGCGAREDKKRGEEHKYRCTAKHDDCVCVPRWRFRVGLRG